MNKVVLLLTLVLAGVLAFSPTASYAAPLVSMFAPRTLPSDCGGQTADVSICDDWIPFTDACRYNPSHSMKTAYFHAVDDLSEITIKSDKPINPYWHSSRFFYYQDYSQADGFYYMRCHTPKDPVTYPNGIPADAYFYVMVYDFGGDRPTLWLKPVCVLTNQAPVPDAGSYLTIDSEDQATTTIYGTATDGDGDDLTFRWLEGATVLQGSQLVGAAGEAYLDLSGLSAFSIGGHTLTLEVSDGTITVTDDMVLTVSNSAPECAAGGGGTYQIGADIVLAGDVADYDGNFVMYHWLEGADILFSGMVATIFGGDPVFLPDHVIIGGLPLGSHTLTLRVSDGINAPCESTVSLEVVDTEDPTLAPLASKYILWPPNHKMVDIAIQANAADNSGCVSITNVDVLSSEPPDTDGDGNTIPDFTDPVVDGDLITLQLRSERAGGGSGRTYSIVIEATDCAGNSTTAIVEISAPHDKGKK